MVKRMNLDDGSIQTLMSAASGLGGAWNDDGTLILSTNPGTPILRVPAGGGEPTAVTRFDSPQQRSHSSPQFLPDQRHFLFFVTGSSEARGVYVGQLDSLDTKRLFDADTPAGVCLERTLALCPWRESCWHNDLIQTGWKRAVTPSR